MAGKLLKVEKYWVLFKQDSSVGTVLKEGMRGCW